MGLFFPALPGSPPSSSRFLPTAGVAGAHVLALAALLTLAPTERLGEMARPMLVRLVELAPSAPPPPAPPPERPRPTKPVLAAPPPLLAVAPASEAVSAPVFTVAAPPPPAPVAASPAPSLSPAPVAPVEAPLVAARFDADYLHNPKPFYPPASRRLGEQGKVLLRVFVSAEGVAEKVELKTSSGFARLDGAAQEAVARWRFVPARRGEQTVAAWVQVPIAFNLDS